MGIASVLWLGKILPPRIGYPFSEWLGRLISSRRGNRLVQSVRANQWVASGKKLNANQLDEITRRTFEHTADCLYDLYHNLTHPERILKMVTLNPKSQRILNERKTARNGTLILIPHLSNFDLAGYALALYGFSLLVLSYPNPTGSYQWQNKFRREFGVEVLPLSLESMRIARGRLQNNGLVLTGLDRPMESSNHQPLFFGYPAPLPVTHVNLAARSGADFLVASCRSSARGKYVVECSDVIPFLPQRDKDQEYLPNAEYLLKEAERMIRHAPDQWSMFYPVWPWALKCAP